MPRPRPRVQGKEDAGSDGERQGHGPEPQDYEGLFYASKAV